MLDHHHMPGMGDEDEAGRGDVFVEISGILSGGQLVLFPAQNEGRDPDLGESVPDVKVIAGLEIVEYHRGHALSGHTNKALPQGLGSG